MSKSKSKSTITSTSSTEIKRRVVDTFFNVAATHDIKDPVTARLMRHGVAAMGLTNKSNAVNAAEALENLTDRSLKRIIVKDNHFQHEDTHIDVSPDGMYLLYITMGHGAYGISTIYICNVKTRLFEHKIPIRGYISYARYLTSTKIAIFRDMKFEIVDLSVPISPYFSTAPNAGGRSTDRHLAMSSDGKCEVRTNEEISVLEPAYINVKCGAKIDVDIETEYSPETEIKFAPNSHMFAWNYGNTVKIYDPTTKSIVQTLEIKENVYTFEFSHDAKTIAVVDYNGKIKIWEVESGKRVMSFVIPDENPETEAPISMVYTKKYLYVAYDRTIYMYDTETYKLIKKLESDLPIYGIWNVPSMPQLLVRHEKEVAIWDTARMMRLKYAGGNHLTPETHVYKGKTYKVRVGSRGGKYIIKGAKKEKVYI